MSRAVEFRREIARLFHERTFKLQHVIDGQPAGKPPTLSRTERDTAILELQDLASVALATGLARQQFENGVRDQRRWHVTGTKGRLYEDRKQSFKIWYSHEIDASDCVYVFWAGRTCEYVGRTGRGGARAAEHFEKHWFRHVTRIDVHVPADRRDIVVLECLAKHRFQPRRNKIRPAKRKWTRSCPMCTIHSYIDSELRVLFRF